ncbi:MAG: hypothetical protein EZS28_009646 [Streblomastix strix]|uniref:Uncharacterized protein n=1 Tax=Streblomastix strix TaxID=222440 RepID=A0A5J4WIB4_9EUKA|nr:MAG: hypothetical protein EZS28_009646 [Streblomastix strix]
MDKEIDIDYTQEDYERKKQQALRLDVHERKRILFKVGYSDTLLDKEDKEYGHKVGVLMDYCRNQEINKKNKEKDKYQIEETISQLVKFRQQSALHSNELQLTYANPLKRKRNEPLTKQQKKEKRQR